MTEALAEHDAAAQADMEDVMPQELTVPGPPVIRFRCAFKIAPGQIVTADGGMESKEILRARFAKKSNYTPTENSVIQRGSETWIIREVEGKEAWSHYWSIKAAKS